jgi:hypothetical protein
MHVFGIEIVDKKRHDFTGNKYTPLSNLEAKRNLSKIKSLEQLFLCILRSTGHFVKKRNAVTILKINLLFFQKMRLKLGKI